MRRPLKFYPRQVIIGRLQLQVFRLVPGQSRLGHGGIAGERMFDGCTERYWWVHLWPVSILATWYDGLEYVPR